jgi:DNA-binding winged helix-turn-helix (wHTH) protein/Tol biopolymer transport system component
VTATVREFGSFQLDPPERLLLRGRQPVPLTPKAFDLLVYLVEHAGRLVTKRELLAALWPGTFVEETNLTFTISILRKALGDGQNGEQFIQTVATRGYRFVAPVSVLKDTPIGGVDQGTAPRVRWRPRAVAILAVFLAAIALVVAGLSYWRGRPSISAPMRFTIPLPDATLATYAVPLPQISPDGKRVALIVTSGSNIWLRVLGEENAQPIAGTENATGLFWAPDSQHLAFTTPAALKILRLSDRAIHVRCEPCQPAGGGTWSRTGLILFPSVGGALFGIPASGGQPEAVTKLDRTAGETAHIAPHFLPDGNRFLYVVQNADAKRSGLYVRELGSSLARLLLPGDVPAIYAAPGYLLFVRDGTLTSQPFDTNRLELLGAPSPLLAAERSFNQLAFSASNTGVLTYSIVKRPLTQFQWVGRHGEPQKLVGDPGEYYTFDLSADNSRLVYGRTERGRRTSLWVYDLERGVPQRLTPERTSHADPRWVGDRIVATRWLPQPQAIVQIAPHGEESVLVTSAVATMVDSVSRDGAYLLYRARGQHLLAMPLSGNSKPIPVADTSTGSMNQAQLSPDNRWVVYQESDQSGRFEVWLARFPPTTERWRVSTDGAVQPVWKQDGRELYYLGLDGTLYAVEFGGANRPLSTPKPLFASGLRPPAKTVEEYAVSRDGQRFLLLRPLEDRVRTSIGVILHWHGLLGAG